MKKTELSRRMTVLELRVDSIRGDQTKPRLIAEQCERQQQQFMERQRRELAQIKEALESLTKSFEEYMNMDADHRFMVGPNGLEEIPRFQLSQVRPNGPQES